MNLNEGFVKPDKRMRARCKMPVMGPPQRKVPKSRSGRSSSTRNSELQWGRSHQSVFLNSSSNRRSISSRSTNDNDEEKIIIALTEGRGEARCEVGLAVVNVSRPLLIICQTSDSQSYTNTLTKLNIFNPSLIIYPITFETGKGSRLITYIKKHFPTTKLMTIPRKAFNKDDGLDRLYKICIPTCFSLLIMIKNRYYALAAVSGLLNYLQDNMYIYYASQSIKLDYQASEGYAIIDIATADRLELVACNQPAEANKYSTLFGIMNRCLTRVGTRHLRSVVLQPLYSKTKINERLDCVEELIRNPEILLSIQAILPKLSTVDQLLSISTLIPEDPQKVTNRQLNYLLRLNSVLDAIEPLQEPLNHLSQPFFVDLRNILRENDFEVMKKIIRTTIYETAYLAKGQQAEQQRIWAIKPGLNGLLDLVRKTYSERIDDMREYIKNLSSKYDLPLTLASNNKKGFHITMPLNTNQRSRLKPSDLPLEFIQVFRLANSFTMKTIELVNLSTRIDDILTDLFSLSNLMIHDIIVKIKQYAGLFYRLVEGISYLDVLQSLAEASYASSWARPIFDEFTDVTSGHHPILDFLCHKTPISNPIQACEHYNLHIITGPNGAGKSIFIRQVMLLQIMAQTGCFVPAQSASFRPADKMFARISNDDDMESNASSFVLEMTEVNYILTTMTDQSLIIIDELCRSTSVEEGTALAMSFCDILAKTRAYTFVTTHFTVLTKLADLFFNMKVWQLQTIPNGDPKVPKTMKLDFRFSLIPGPTTLRGYGIYMVRGIWPPEVLDLVDEIQEKYTKIEKDHKFSILDKRARLRYDLECKIGKLKLKKKFTLGNLNKCISQYQEEMKKLGEVNNEDIIEELNNIQEEALSSNDLNHSIFNASSVHNDVSIMQLSKAFMDAVSPDIIENNSSTVCNLQQQEKDGELTFVISEHSQPQTQLNASQSSSCSMQSFNLPPILEPEINLSYDNSQCSLNLTQRALECEETQINNDIDTKNNELLLEDSRNLFKTCENMDNEAISCVSQMSSSALSQKLELIRNQISMAIQEENVSFIAPFTPPKKPVVPESPFITDFERGLREDKRKTSTPLQVVQERVTNNTTIMKMQGNEENNEVKTIQTAKISFTVPDNIENLDIASLAEDLESFAEQMIDEEINTDDDHTKTPGKIKKIQPFFPCVTVIEGPNWSSSEESIDISQGEVIKPILKIPRPETCESKINNDNEDHMKKMIEAFNSLSNPKTNEGIEESANNDIEMMIEAFNSLSNPQKNRQKKDENNKSKIEEISQINEKAAVTNDNKKRKIPNICDNNNKGERNQNKCTENINLREIIKENSNNVINNSTEDIYETCEEDCVEDDNQQDANDTFSSIVLCYSPLVPRTQENISVEKIPSAGCQKLQEVNGTMEIEEQAKKNINDDALLNSSGDTDYERSTMKCVSQHQDISLKKEKHNQQLETLHNNEEIIIIDDDFLRKSNVGVNETLPSENVNEQLKIIDKSMEDRNRPEVNGQDVILISSTENSLKSIDVTEASNFILKVSQKCEESREENENPDSICKKQIDNGKIAEEILRKRKKTLGIRRSITTLSSPKQSRQSLKRKPTTSQVNNSPPTNSNLTIENRDVASNENSVENNENTRETTNISEASNLRNLVGDCTSSFNEARQIQDEINLICGGEDASKKRKLDVELNFTSNSYLNSTNASDKAPPQFKVPIKQKKPPSFSTEEEEGAGGSTSQKNDCASKNNGGAGKKTGNSKRFVYPSQMSETAIRQAFYEQDRKFFESSGSSTELAKIWEERLKRPPRPTPKQIKQSTCLATIIKTSDGVTVIPDKKPKTSKNKKKNLPSLTKGTVNMNIFSDHNAEIFDEFIKSDKKDYKAFNFKFGYDGNSRHNDEGGNLFNFKQVNAVSAEYTPNSQSWTFVRKCSEEMNLTGTSTNAPFYFTPIEENNVSLTTEGFYMQNRDDIASLLRKYK